MRVGLIGAGLMGSPMGERIINSGHSLIVYNRTRARAEHLGSLGAEIADSPKSVIEQAYCTILMLSEAASIEETIPSSAGGGRRQS